MADNTTLDAGTGGDVIATDDIAGVKYQRVKISQGADGSATDVGIGGGTEATALRVTVASDSTGVLSVDDNGGALTVDGTVDTELTTADLDTGAGTDTRAVVGLAGTASGGAQLIPGSSTDGLLVNLGANNDVTVSGVATAANQTTVIGHLDGVEGLLTTIDADTGTLAGAVAGTEMQVDIVSAPTITVDSELTTADLDTGAGSDTRAVVGLAGSASGGAQLIPGSSTDGLLVNLGANNDVTVSGVATAANQTTIIGHVDGIEALLTTIDADTSTLAAAVSTEMQVDVVGALPAGDNNIGNVDIASAIPAGTNNIGDVDVASIAAGTNTIGAVNVKPATSGGLTIFRSIDLDETEEEVKATAGQVFGWYAFNAAATTHYIKLYNATAANVTVGSTTPVMTIPIPAGAAANVEFTNGVAFGTAITAAATTGIADADTGAPAANAVTLNLLYA